MRRARVITNEMKEQWDKLSREDLQEGKYLFDHFEVVGVEERRIWLRMSIGVMVMEAQREEGEGKGAVVRISTVFWDPKEDKSPIPAPVFYAHLLYQRVLLQGAGNWLESRAN